MGENYIEDYELNPAKNDDNSSFKEMKQNYKQFLWNKISSLVYLDCNKPKEVVMKYVPEINRNKIIHL